MAGDTGVMEDAPMMDALDANDPRVPSQPLVGFGGRVALNDCAPYIESGSMDIRQFVKAFREKHTLKSETCEPMLQLLEMGGLSRSRVERMVMAVLTTQFKQKIPDMSQDQLAELLEKSYSYLTVTELNPIAIAALERLQDVHVSTWQEIVENGMDEEPYTDMPLSIKRRIWLSVPMSFEWEVNQALNEVADHHEPSRLQDFMVTDDRAKKREDNRVLQKFLRLLGNNDALLVQLIDKLVESAATVDSASKRMGIANLFHDILTSLSNRFTTNVEKLRVMARYLDCGGANSYIGIGELREIRDGLSESASCGPVALLVASVYTRDLITEQLVNRLIEHKKAPGGSDQATALKTLTGVLERDQYIENLTYVCLSNIRAASILSANAPLDPAQTKTYFTDFYPFLCQEMALDDGDMVQNYAEHNARMSGDLFHQAAQRGMFERRILTGYGLMLFARNNVIALSKLRLAFDVCFSHANTDEESREVAIAQGLVYSVTEY